MPPDLDDCKSTGSDAKQGKGRRYGHVGGLRTIDQKRERQSAAVAIRTNLVCTSLICRPIGRPQMPAKPDGIRLQRCQPVARDVQCIQLIHPNSQTQEERVGWMTKDPSVLLAAKAVRTTGRVSLCGSDNPDVKASFASYCKAVCIF